MAQLHTLTKKLVAIKQSCHGPAPCKSKLTKKLVAIERESYVGKPLVGFAIPLSLLAGVEKAFSTQFSRQRGR